MKKEEGGTTMVTMEQSSLQGKWHLGGGIMSALTTVEDKDNLICEIKWI